MAIGTVATAGQLLRFAGTFQSVENLSQSTATTNRNLSLYTDVSVIGGGTATGSGARNIFTLPTGAVEGQEKWVYFGTTTAATGEASVRMVQPAGELINYCDRATTTVGPATVHQVASATAGYVFQSADDWLQVRYLNDLWHVVAFRGVTQATVT